MTMPIVRSNLPKAWENLHCTINLHNGKLTPNLDLHLRNNADTDCFDHNYSDLFFTSYYVDA